MFEACHDFLYFDGESFNEDYLEWELEVERSFYNYNIFERNQVRYVDGRFTGRANAWWEHLTHALHLDGHSKVITWSKMKKLLRSQFLSSDFKILLKSRYKKYLANTWIPFGEENLSELKYDYKLEQMKDEEKNVVRGNVDQMPDDIPLLCSDIRPPLVDEKKNVDEDPFVWLVYVLPLVDDIANARLTFETLTPSTRAKNYLAKLEQSPPPSLLSAMKPCFDAIAKEDMLKHQDREAKVIVAACIGLKDTTIPSFKRPVIILETLAIYSDEHPSNVRISMQTIMVPTLDESDDLLVTMLSPLGRRGNEFTMEAKRLALNVMEQCAVKLELSIRHFLVSSLSSDIGYLDSSLDSHEVIYDLYEYVSQILSGIIPFMTGEFLADNLEIRQKAVQLLGDPLALSGIPIFGSFQLLSFESVRILIDRAFDVCFSVMGHLKSCLMLNMTYAEASLVIKALLDRLLDYDENVRKQLVAAICVLTCHYVKVISVDTIKIVVERLLGNFLAIKQYTIDRSADFYICHCLKRENDLLKYEDINDIEPWPNWESLRLQSHSWPSLPDGTELECTSCSSRYGITELLLGLIVRKKNMNLDEAKMNAIAERSQQHFLARIGAIEYDGRRSEPNSSLNQQHTLLPWMDGVARLVLYLGLKMFQQSQELLTQLLMKQSIDHCRISFKEAGAIKF